MPTRITQTPGANPPLGTYDVWANLLINAELVEEQRGGRPIPGPGSEIISGIDYDSILVCPSTADLAVGLTQNADGARRVAGFLLDPGGAMKATDFSYFINGYFAPNIPALQNPASDAYKRARLIPSTQVNFAPGGGQPPLKSLAAIKGSTEMAYFGDGIERQTQAVFQPQIADYISGKRHGSFDSEKPVTSGKTNITFFDGHAESVDRKNLPGGDPLGTTFPTTEPMVERARELNAEFPGAKFRLDQVDG